MSVHTNRKSLITSPNITEFFRSSVEDATANQKLSVDPDTVFYIVNLLASFTRSARLFHTTPGGKQIETLAELHGHAITSDSTRNRNDALRRLGDLALFLSGVFRGHLGRRGINVDYCVGMGGGAYASLADSDSRDLRIKCLRHTFGELAENFECFVDVVAEASFRMEEDNDTALLKLYGRWLADGNQHDEKRLRKLGIFPMHTDTNRHH